MPLFSNSLQRRSGLRRSLWRSCLWLGIVVGCVLLFVKEPGPEQHRLTRQIWDLGHLFLFGFIGFFVGEHLRSPRPWRRFWGALLVAAALGWLIEVMQLMIGRDYSLDDVAGDTLGMACGLLIGGHRVLSVCRGCLRLALGISVLGVALKLTPVLRSAVDAFAAWREFPVLVDFEQGFAPGLQVERLIAVGADLHVEGRALRVDLHPGSYPGFTLDDFPNDWRGWRYLVIDVENPASAMFAFSCRINDARHEISGNQFDDRFNRRFDLQPGRNQLRIDLAEVERAPRQRSMNMTEIRTPMCFAVGLAQPRTLLLHSIHLE